jgi:hypothetical protein
VSRHPELYHWTAELARRFPHLAKSFVVALALWSLGMILARRAGLSSVCLHLAEFLGLAENSPRQRLKEFYKDAHDKNGSKRGVKRQDFAVCDCFAPLLAWVLSLFRGNRLALALDVTNLGERFHVLCVSVVIRGMGIPVAWAILPGGVKDPWNPHWLELLGRLRAALGLGWEVLVLTDRGLESSELFRAIVECGWHPLMRVKGGGSFRPDGWHKFHALKKFAPRVGCGRFAAQGEAYKDRAGRLCGVVLLACWEEGYADAWLLLTDLPVCACRACWYGYRSWIEQQFKVQKSEGWNWQRTRMTDPKRAERLWLALAVATLWVVAVGVEEEEKQRERRWCKCLADVLKGRRQAQEADEMAGGGESERLHRVFALGQAHVAGAWLRGEYPMPGQLAPEPWPQPDHEYATVSEEDFDNT